MSIPPEDEWLSLREAAEMLGMHPATVRLWADRNELPSRRTSGGHRRFRRTDIEARLRQETERKPSPAAQLLVQSVLGRVRFAFTDGTLTTFSWYTHFDDLARDSYRDLGRRCSNCSYALWPGPPPKKSYAQKQFNWVLPTAQLPVTPMSPWLMPCAPSSIFAAWSTKACYNSPKSRAHANTRNSPGPKASTRSRFLPTKSYPR